MMRKRALSIVTALCSALFAAGLFTGCDEIGSGSGYRYDDAAAYSAGSGFVSAANVSSVSVDWIDGDVTFQTAYASDEIVFAEETEETDENYLLHYAVVGGELKIKFQKSGIRDKNGLSKKLTVSIPDGMALRSLEAETVSGALDVWAISASEVDLETVSGKIEVNYATARELNAESVSGDISVFAESACSAEIDTVNGDVLIETTGVGFRVSFDTVSGAVENRCGAEISGRTYSYGNGVFFAEVDTVNGNLILEYAPPALPTA